ncbi:hypothetical protein M9458_024130, partial [Cirrhinus mrigala]
QTPSDVCKHGSRLTRSLGLAAALLLTVLVCVRAQLGRDPSADVCYFWQVAVRDTPVELSL